MLRFFGNGKDDSEHSEDEEQHEEEQHQPQPKPARGHAVEFVESSSESDGEFLCGFRGRYRGFHHKPDTADMCAANRLARYSHRIAAESRGRVFVRLVGCLVNAIDRGITVGKVCTGANGGDGLCGVGLSR